MAVRETASWCDKRWTATHFHKTTGAEAFCDVRGVDCPRPFEIVVEWPCRPPKTPVRPADALSTSFNGSHSHQ
jgi:hypothetical protein